MTWLVRTAMCDMMPATGELPGVADCGSTRSSRGSAARARCRCG